MEMELTKQFAQFIKELKYEDIPESAITSAKERILDNLGAAAAGCTSWSFRKNLLDACSKLGVGDSAVIGGSDTLFPAARASMINAAFAQANELDDGHMYAGVHAGCCVVSTALVIGAQLGCCGKDILTAVVAGYEVVYRLGVAMCPHLILKGFHPTAVLDACGSLAVVAKLTGMSEEKIANGLGMAGLYGGGLMEATISGQQSKCVMAGNAAASGVMAAYFADAGLEGTLSVFEGKSGLFFSMSKDVDVEKVCVDLGKTFTLGDTYTKFYPTCRHAQAGIEAVLDLKEENQFEYSDVESIHVGTYPVAILLTGTIFEPQDQGEAKYSMPYGIAVGLVTGSVAPHYLKEKYYKDRFFLDLAAKVTVTLDDEMERLYPERRGAKVSVCLKDGRRLEKTIFDLKGSPANPVGWAALERKFVANCEPLLGNERAVQAAEQIHCMDKLESVADFYAAFCKQEDTKTA